MWKESIVADLGCYSSIEGTEEAESRQGGIGAQADASRTKVRIITA
jgi:hypothetical protein